MSSKKFYLSWDGVNIENLEKFCIEDVLEDSQCTYLENVYTKGQVDLLGKHNDFQCHWREDYNGIYTVYCHNSQSIYECMDK
jgi:hypothetical protein